MPLQVIVTSYMHSPLVSWSRFVFLAGSVLGLLLIIPAASLPLQLSKTLVFSVCAAIAALLFVFGGGARDLVRSHGFWAALAVGLLPLVYLASYSLSLDKSVGLLGYGVETDTLLFTVLLALTFLLSFGLFKTLRTTQMLTKTLFWALVAAAVFQCVVLLIGPALSLFGDRSFNLVGKWNDLGLLCTLLVLMLSLRTREGVSAPLARALEWVGGLVLVFLLAFINFDLAWQLLLGGSLLILALGLLARRREGEGSWYAAVPKMAALGAAVAIVFLLYGNVVNTTLTKVIPLNSLEVRPGFSSTLQVVDAGRSSLRQTLLGTGPNTFGQQWLLQKPAEVNATPFWALDFNVGYSTLATAFGSTGLLGALAWLLPLLLVLLALLRVVRLGALSPQERGVATKLGMASLFFAAALMLYVPSQNLLLLAFVLMGACVGFLQRQGRSAESEQPATRLQGLTALVFGAVVLVLVVGSAGLIARRSFSEGFVASGVRALSQNNPQAALAAAERAQRVERIPDALLLYADAGQARLAAIAQDQSLKPEDARAQFTDLAQKTIAAGQSAIIAAPRDYRSYLSLGRVYDLLNTLQVQGAYEGAKSAYSEAQKLNPNSPAIPLMLARLEAAHGDVEALRQNLSHALTLKPDYTDAILFVVQLDVAQNDLNAAIRDTKLAVQTAPGVASIWFELGLLYYAGNDTKDAIPALEQAIVLQPNYANAKYFLALSYWVQDRKEDSQKLFQELARENPDNQNLKAVLQNIAQNRSPLEGLQQPTEGSAPISE